MYPEENLAIYPLAARPSRPPKQIPGLKIPPSQLKQSKNEKRIEISGRAKNGSEDN